MAGGVMDAVLKVVLRLVVASTLGACAVGSAGWAVARRELAGWPVWSRRVVIACGVLAGACAGALAASWLETVELLVILFALLACSVADLGRRIIPNRAVAVVLGARAAYLALGPLVSCASGVACSWAFEGMCASLAGGLTVLLVLAAVRLFLMCARGCPRGDLGGGDVKLLVACGVCLGPVGGAACVVLSCVLSLAFCMGAWGFERVRGVARAFPSSFPLAPEVLASVVILTAYRAI